MKRLSILILLVMSCSGSAKKDIEGQGDVLWDITDKDALDITFDVIGADLPKNGDLQLKEEEYLLESMEHPEELGVEIVGGCDPCGVGSVKGLVCAPNQKTAIPDALVWIDTVDCNGNPIHIEVKSSATGEFILQNVPCGMQTIKQKKGSFSHQFSVFIEQNMENNLEGKIDRCFEGNAAKIAVITGDWDKIEYILYKLGFKYDLYELYSQKWEWGGEWGGSEAYWFLKDLSKMKKYDVIFINCGQPWVDIMSSMPEFTQNIIDFVNGGGSLYASDWAYPVIEWPWPDAIDFYGDDKSSAPQILQGNQVVEADILDPTLAQYLGKSKVKIKYGLGPLVAVESAGAGTVVHIQGPVKQFNNKVMPLMMSFVPQPDAGRVVYPNFHNDEQITQEIAVILNYLVFLL